MARKDAAAALSPSAVRGGFVVTIVATRSRIAVASPSRPHASNNSACPSKSSTSSVTWKTPLPVRFRLRYVVDFWKGRSVNTVNDSSTSGPIGDTFTVRLPSGEERQGTVYYRGVDAGFATQRDVSRFKRDIKTFEIRLRVEKLDEGVGVGALAQQPYPSKAIRFIVPFPPGGTTDVVARYVAPVAAEILGQPIVIENLPGAGGITGTQSLIKATPDGNTIAFVSNNLCEHLKDLE